MDEKELVFTEILKCNRVDLYLNARKTLSQEQALMIASVLKRRINGEPIDYILGKKSFMGLDFKVNEDVLIPREDTEILVETAVKYAKKNKTDNLKILDIGTGSGCIAVSLAKFISNCSISAIDISKAALFVALENANLHNVNNKIEFIHADLFNLSSFEGGYDLIVSNPPYIQKDIIDTLSREVLAEPAIALDGGKDGLDFYRELKNKAKSLLKDNAFLLVEIGFDQLKQVKEIFESEKDLGFVESVNDYGQITRVLVFTKRGS